MNMDKLQHWARFYVRVNVTCSRAKPQQIPSMEKHAHPPRWFTVLYTQHLLDSQSFEFEICMLQALNMPPIRCTNVFSKGGYPVTLLSPPRRLVPSLGMLIHQGWFTVLYTQHLLHSQSFEFEICKLQALNMPLIR